MAIKSISNIVPESHEIATIKKLRKLAKKQKLQGWGIESEPLRMLVKKNWEPDHWAGTGMMHGSYDDPVTHYRITFSWEEK